MSHTLGQQDRVENITVGGGLESGARARRPRRRPDGYTW